MRHLMRLALAFLFVAATVGLAGAQSAPSKNDEVLRQRLLLKERFNKGYDVQIENAQDPVRARARCKAEARRHYSAIHPLKRRKFVEDCVARQRR